MSELDEGCPTSGEEGDMAAGASSDTRATQLLRRFLELQQDRAHLYSSLKSGFTDYLKTGSELTYKELCGQITTDFNNCSRQVLEIESALREPEVGREDLAQLLADVQVREKEKLRMTATLQVLRRAGRPSERAHADSRGQPHSCHGNEEGVSALELAEAEAEYDAAFKEATQAEQEAVIAILENMQEVRYVVDELAPAGT